MPWSSPLVASCDDVKGEALQIPCLDVVRSPQKRKAAVVVAAHGFDCALLHLFYVLVRIVDFYCARFHFRDARERVITEPFAGFLSGFVFHGDYLVARDGAGLCKIPHITVVVCNSCANPTSAFTNKVHHNVI